MDNFKVSAICQHKKIYPWVEKDKYVCRECGRVIEKKDFPESYDLQNTEWFSISISGQDGTSTTHYVPKKYIDDIEAVSDVFVDCYKEFIAEREGISLHIEDD